MSTAAAHRPITEETIIANTETDALSQTRVVWYPGDTIKPNEKHFTPEWKQFGGVFLPQFYTIQHDGNRLTPYADSVPPQGMVYRCKFTQMRTKMRQEWSQMLPPQDLQYWSSSYVIKNGKYNPDTREYSDQVIRAPGQVYRPDIYPGREINEIVQASPGNDVGGRVEIVALAGADRAAIDKAQYFFFPDWDEITAMTKFLPATIRELELHIQQRISATSELDSTTQSKYRMIGSDMLRGCTQYRMGGLSFLKAIEDDANAAKAKGTPYSYPDLALMLLDQLEQKRKDDLVSGTDSAMTDVAREMRTDREARMRLDERRQYTDEVVAGLRERDETEEIRLGIKKAPAIEAPEIHTPFTENVMYTEPFAPEEVTNLDMKTGVVPEVTENMLPEPPPPPASTNTYALPNDLCGHPTANGTCARTATENGKCWQHQ